MPQTPPTTSHRRPHETKPLRASSPSRSKTEGISDAGSHHPGSSSLHDTSASRDSSAPHDPPSSCDSSGSPSPLGSIGPIGPLSPIESLARAFDGVSPLFLGLALIDVWSSWLNAHGIFFSMAAWPVGKGGATAIVLLAFCILWWNGRRRGLGNGAFVSVGILATVATVPLCLFPATFAPSTPSLLFAIAIVSCGAAQAVAFVGWGALFARMELKRALVCILLSAIAGALLKILLDLVPPFVAQPCICSLPVISTVMLALSIRKIGSLGVPRKQGYPAPSENTPVAKFALCMLVYALAICGLRYLPFGESELAHSALLHILEIILAMIVLAWTCVAQRPLRFTPLWISLFAVLLTALLMTCLWQAEFAIVLVNFAQTFSTILVVTVAVDFCQHSDKHPYAIVALLRLAAALPSYLSYLLTGLAVEVDPMAFAAVMMWGLSLASIYFVTERNLIALRLFDNLAQPAPTTTGITEVMERCAALGEEHALTAREVEIMSMICLGKSKALIARELTLSEATVKTHVRNLYGKLGVHSKNELQELMGL